MEGIQLVLSAMGIKRRKPKEHLQNRVSFRSVLCPFGLILHLCFLYCTLILIRKGEYSLNKLVFTSEICLMFSMLIWYCLIFQNKRYSDITRLFEKLWWLMNLHTIKEKRMLNVITVSVVIFPLVLTTILHVATRYDSYDGFVDFYLLGHVLHSHPTHQDFMLFIGMFVYYSSRFFVPTVYVAFHGITSVTLRNAIRYQAGIIERSISTQSFHDEIRVYRLVIRSCRTFEKFSNASFFWTMSLYFTVMYIGLGVSFGGIDREPGIAIWIESFLTISISGASIVVLLALASGIPNAMMDNAIRFKDIYQSMLLDDFGGVCVNSRTLQVINALSNVDPVYLTVYGLLNVDKGLILSTFGCFITYCILVMQLKTNSDP